MVSKSLIQFAAAVLNSCEPFLCTGPKENKAKTVYGAGAGIACEQALGLRVSVFCGGRGWGKGKGKERSLELVRRLGREIVEHAK